MDWIIQVSHEEARQGALAAASAASAGQALRKWGCAVLRGVLSQDFVQGACQEFLRRYPALDSPDMAREAAKPAPNPVMEVGAARFEVSLEMSGLFGAPELFANELVLKLLQPVLGHEMRLSSFSVVTSYPGATAQHVHRDHDHLYPELNLGRLLPPHAVNVAVPLIDIDIETGPTGIWPGSHLWPRETIPSAESVTAIPFRRGDCVLIDYRTLHMGLPNQGGKVRPILYMVYARPWFFDEVNHTNRPPLVMPLATYRSLSDAAKQLTVRAFSAQVRAAYLSQAATYRAVE